MGTERKPIIVRPPEPIVVRPSSPIVVSPLEPIIIGPSIFLRQETAEKRGVNSCVPTSIINAAIGLNLITPEQASVAYERIMQELVLEKDLWNSANLLVANLNDPRLAQITEKHLPVQLGYQHDRLGRMMLVPRDFDDIRKELAKQTAHVITDEVAFHAYASIRHYDNKFFYIDPMRPNQYMHASKDNFQRLFHTDGQGWASAILVNPR